MPKRKNRDRAERRRAERTLANRLTRGLAAAADPQAPAKRVRHQLLVDRLERRGQISPGQRDAGVRLAIDYRIASSGKPRLVMDYLGLGHGKVPRRQGFVDNDGPTQLDARRRFEAALADLGPGLVPVVIHAVIADRPVGEWAKCYGRATGFGMELLRQGLDALTRHYARPAAERIRLAAAAAPRHVDVPVAAPMLAPPTRSNGAAPKVPAAPAATGLKAFLTAQAIGRGVADDLLDAALAFAAGKGWANGHAAPEDSEMVTATRRMLEIARARDERRPAV